jgi:hypothetical protein
MPVEWVERLRVERVPDVRTPNVYDNLSKVIDDTWTYLRLSLSDVSNTARSTIFRRAVFPNISKE